MDDFQMKRALLFLLLVVASVAARAGLPSDASLTIGGTRSAFGNMVYRQAGLGVWEAAFEGAGTPMVETAGAVISADGGSGLAVARTGTMLNPAGNPMAMSVGGRLSAAEVAGALGRFAVKTTAVLATGVALYDLAKELGFTFNNSSGQLQVSKDDPGWTGVDVAGSLQQAINQCGTQYSGCVGRAFPVSPGGNCYNYPFSRAGACVAVFYNGHLNDVSYLVSAVVLMDAVQLPSYATVQDFTDAVAARSGWPTTSNAPSAVRDALQSGETAKLSSPVLSGPATSSGKTTTTVNPDGSKTVTTTIYTNNYDGAKVSTVTNTTVNNYDSHNVSTGTTSTTTQPEAQPASKTQCESNPDSIGCSEYGDIPKADDLKNKTFDLSITPTAFPGGNACPSSLPFTIPFINRSYALSYAPLCDKLALIRPIIVALGFLMAAFILADSFKV